MLIALAKKTAFSQISGRQKDYRTSLLNTNSLTHTVHERIKTYQERLENHQWCSPFNHHWFCPTDLYLAMKHIWLGKMYLSHFLYQYSVGLSAWICAYYVWSFHKIRQPIKLIFTQLIFRSTWLLFRKVDT